MFSTLYRLADGVGRGRRLRNVYPQTWSIEMAESKLTGGCQCGAIRYEVAGTPKRQVACHFTACQRQSGSAFGMTIVVNEEDFRLTKGELKTYASKSHAGRAKIGAFCPECGTRVG